jgi:DNA invertase Pin-like site-specific DNA recombinase
MQEISTQTQAPLKTVRLIPPKPEYTEQLREKESRQLSTAAYCRVSTLADEQELSYESQKEFYMDKIMANPKWRLADIFADEGISATSTKRRKDFNRMIEWCKKGKIDQIITKSISRFARNTVDSLAYIRMLKSMGIGIIFEKEGFNTLEVTNEFVITIYSSLAQGESESQSGNVKWGKRRHFKKGDVIFSYKNFLGYRKGDDGRPEIDSEEAEIIERIYKRFLAGQSRKTIADELTEDRIPTARGKMVWSSAAVYSILTNEKYKGDVVLQKTFVADCLTKKVETNIGQLPQYYVENNHPAIIDKDTWNRVQEELARRGSKRKVKEMGTKTEQGKYSSKYALTELLVCGECGTPYRRCTWNIRGKRKIVWRCISRLDYGTKYCKQSPSMEESVIQDAILSVIKNVGKKNTKVFESLKQYVGIGLSSGNPKDKDDIYAMEVRIREIDASIDDLVASDPAGCAEGKYNEMLAAVADEKKKLRSRIEELKNEGVSSVNKSARVEEIFEAIDKLKFDALEYDDEMVRQIIECVRVISKEKLRITFRWGMEVEVDLDGLP